METPPLCAGSSDEPIHLKVALDFDPLNRFSRQPILFLTKCYVSSLPCGTVRNHNLADTQRAWRSSKDNVKLVGWIVSYQFLYLCNELFVS